MLVINNVATADDYTEDLTLESPFGGRLVYLVANASAVARFRPLPPQSVAGPTPVGVDYGQEQVLTPQSSFVDKISGVQFRSAVAGSPARIVASLSEPGDILPASGTPFTGVLAASGGVGAAGEVAFQDFQAPVTLTAVTEAGATVVVTAPAFTADGTAAVIIEFFAPRVDGFTQQNPSPAFVLYQDGASIGPLGWFAPNVASGAEATNVLLPVYLRRRLTPAAGSRTYSIRGYHSGASNPVVQAGAGASGQFAPGFIRITTA